MSPPSRKVAEPALRSSLEMFVLILITFVAASVGEHLSCDEYCTLLKSGQTGGRRSECYCHPQNAETVADKNPNLEGNPIYYEPVELHPTPDISFVYQPFLIPNPTSSSDSNPATRSLSNQESEHHRKYKRKDNVIHRISIDTSNSPLYLDIDIQNNPARSRSSQNHINEFDDLQLTEQDLKDCIDLHLLVHFRRNESDNLKQIWDSENLDKYFHISDADLMMEINKRCKQPSNIVSQSLRQIKERISVIKPQYSNYSDSEKTFNMEENLNGNIENTNENISGPNEPIVSISTQAPLIVPEKKAYTNYKDENKLNTSTSDKTYVNIKQQPNFVKNEVFKFNESNPKDSLSVIPIKTMFESNHDEEKHVNDNKSINKHDEISYREVLNEPELKQSPELTLLTKQVPETEIDIANTVQYSEFAMLDNKGERDNMLAQDMSINSKDILRTASVSTIIESEFEDNNSEKLKNNIDDMFPTTIQNDLIYSTFVTDRSNLHNNFDIVSTSTRDHNIINTSTLKMENDQEPGSSNVEYVFVKNTDRLPELTTYNMLSKSTEKSQSNDFFFGTTDREGTYTNTYVYEPPTTLVKTQSKNNLTEGNNFTTLESILDLPKSTSREDGVTPTTEEIFSNNVTYINRTVIPEQYLQTTKIIVTEYSNETFISTIDEIEESPNNDYIGIKSFEMDVADLIPSDNQTSVENSKQKEYLDGKNAEESTETSNTSEISGNLFFKFKKLLIPMRFTQAPDGDLKLTLDGASFCSNLLKDSKNNGILAILCNSAVHDKHSCSKI